MEANMVNNLINEALTNVNVAIVVALMAVGFIIKHVKFLEKIQNDLIPPILFVLSIVASFIQSGVSLESVIAALVSAAIAIGLHQTGKNIFSVTIIPSVLSKLGYVKESEITVVNEITTEDAELEYESEIETESENEEEIEEEIQTEENTEATVVEQ